MTFIVELKKNEPDTSPGKSASRGEVLPALTEFAAPAFRNEAPAVQ